MNPNTPNFIPDNQMPQNNSAPDFIPDEQADKYFGTSKSQGITMTNNPVGGAVDFLAPALKQNANVISDTMNYGSSLPNAKGNLPQAISNASNTTGHLVSQLPGAALSDAETAFNTLGGGALLKGGAKVLTHPGEVVKTIAQIPKYLSKGGIAGLTDKAASKATQQGNFVHWDDLMQQARQKAIKQFGDNAATRKALDNVISPRTPAGIENPLSPTQLANGATEVAPNDLVKALLGELKLNPEKAISPIDELFSGGAKPIAGKTQNVLQQTPEQLLQLRRNLLSSYGKTLLQAPTEKGISALENKVAGVVRGTVSENLHRIAPGTIRPDQLYKMYSKGGPVLKNLLKIIGIPALAISGYEALK